MRRLIVHIGLSKTGSTSLQHFLFDNRAALQRQGIRYPVSDAPNPNRAHNYLATSIASGYADLPPAFNGGRALKLNELEWVLSNGKEDNFILSAEKLGNVSSDEGVIETIKSLGLKHDLHVVIIAFIRPQHTWINSNFTQFTKSLRVSCTFVDFVNFMLCSTSTNYDAFLSNWWTCGMEFIPVPYTGEVMNQGLEAAFLDVAGLSERAGKLLDDQPRRKLNPTPGPRTIETCRRLTKKIMGRDIVEDDPEWKHNPQRLHLARAVGQIAELENWNLEPFVGLTNSLRDRIREETHLSNTNFAARFWARQWDDIFAKEMAADFVSNEINSNTVSKAMDYEFDQVIHRLLQKR